MYLTDDQELELTKLEKYLIRQGREDLVRSMKNATIEEMENKLLAYAKHAQEITNTKNRDEELIEARRKVSTLNAPYSEQLRMNKKLARYVSLILKDEEERLGLS